MVKDLKIKKLPESEFEVMMAVWEHGGKVTSEVLADMLDKEWKKPTLLSLLTRLCERGFLACEKQGKINVYTPLVAREDYIRRESAGFLKRVHQNSVTSLVASLYDGEAITRADLDELEKFIREAEK